jgi:hypothetical protein
MHACQPAAMASLLWAPTGSMTLRYQPLPDQPYTFFDIKAKTQVGAVVIVLIKQHRRPSSWKTFALQRAQGCLMQ